MGKSINFVEACSSFNFRQESRISMDRRHAEYPQNRSFFAMQEEHKLAIAHPGGSEPQRGFSSIGAESSAGLYRKGILKAQLTEDLHDSRVGDRKWKSSQANASG